MLGVLFFVVLKCVFYLVDLIHHPEGAAVQLLQGHEVQHGGDTALPSALVVDGQLVKLRAAVKLDPDSDSVFVILFLRSVHHGQKNRNRVLNDVTLNRISTFKIINRTHLILCVKIHLSCTLHGAKEVTEFLIDLFNQLLQRVEPTVFGLGHKHNQ